VLVPNGENGEADSPLNQVLVWSAGTTKIGTDDRNGFGVAA